MNIELEGHELRNADIRIRVRGNDHVEVDARLLAKNSSTDKMVNEREEVDADSIAGLEATIGEILSSMLPSG